MRMINPLSAIVLIVLLSALVSGCSKTTTQEDIDESANKAKIEKAAEKVRMQEKIDSLQQEWRQFRMGAKVTISANDSTINHYKNVIAGTDSDRRIGYTKMIDSLELKNQKLKLMIVEYPDSTTSTWEQFKRDFDRDLNELAAALRDFSVSNN